MVRDITFMITHSFNINDLILETRSPSKCSILWLWSYISAPSPCPARPNIHILLLKQIILLQYVWNPNKVSNFLNSLSALDSNHICIKFPTLKKIEYEMRRDTRGANCEFLGLLWCRRNGLRLGATEAEWYYTIHNTFSIYTTKIRISKNIYLFKLNLY